MQAICENAYFLIISNFCLQVFEITFYTATCILIALSYDTVHLNCIVYVVQTSTMVLTVWGLRYAASHEFRTKLTDVEFGRNFKEIDMLLSMMLYFRLVYLIML